MDGRHSTIEPRARGNWRGGARRGRGICQRRKVTMTGISIFRPKIGKKEDYETGEYRFSRRSDWYSLLSKQLVCRAEVNGIYKQKVDKVLLVDHGEIDCDKLGGGEARVEQV